MEEHESNSIPFYSDYVIEDALDLFIEGFEEEEQVHITYDERPGSETSELTVPISSGESGDTTTPAEAIQPAAPDPNVRATRKFVDLLQEERVTKIRKVHSRLSALQIQQADRKETLPRSLRNSIHSAYPLMLMNAINSADLTMIQSYFSAFMTGPCTFMVSLKADRQYGLPKALCAFGPQLFTHYLFGCFASYPDMAVKMHDSRTSYFNGRARITIDVTVCGTKILDIPEYEWAPGLERMSALYSNKSRSESGATTPAHSSSESDSADCLEDIITPDAAKETAMCEVTEQPGPDGMKKNKKKKSKMKLPIIAPSAANVAAAQRVPRIPQEFVAATVCHARIVPVPKMLRTIGSMTLFLDEHNCMQHLLIDVDQDRCGGAAAVNQAI